jgi:hypothetical protein
VLKFLDLLKMIKSFKFLICSLLLFSCENNEPVDWLTNGRWIQNNGFNPSINESIRFDPNKSYVAKSILFQGKFNPPISITLSGDWSREGNNIIFMNSTINVSDEISSIPDLPTLPGSPMGSLYGAIISVPIVKDSALINNFTTTQAEWEIIKLTSDSLIVKSNGTTLKYYND